MTQDDLIPAVLRSDGDDVGLKNSDMPCYALEYPVVTGVFLRGSHINIIELY